jgi:phosphoribosylformimino-5-aminoimidazole carboxamide ribotide isomerase
MIIYPAIDLRGGKVVRLKEGDPNQQTVFSDDPVTTAQNWLAQGATWIHMVNLDGAFASANENGQILQAVAGLGGKLQFGGGLRQMADVERAIAQGAARVVLGTAAIQNPDLVVEIINRWGTDALCVALDARDGKVTTHGWQQTIEQTPVEVGQQMVERGVRHALFTDVSRDGGLQGVNRDMTIRLAQETGLQVIASGGINSLDDVRALVESRVVAGAVIGMALYTGQFQLREALALAGGRNAG